MATFFPPSGTITEGRMRFSIQTSSTEEITEVLLVLKITETEETVREYDLSSDIYPDGNGFDLRFLASSGLTFIFSVTTDGGNDLTNEYDIEYDVVKRRIV